MRRQIFKVKAAAVWFFGQTAAKSRIIFPFTGKVWDFSQVLVFYLKGTLSYARIYKNRVNCLAAILKRFLHKTAKKPNSCDTFFKSMIKNRNYIEGGSYD